MWEFTPEIWNRLSILLFNHEVNHTRGTEILTKRLATMLNPVDASAVLWSSDLLV
jgi:hypothetical protein